MKALIRRIRISPKKVNLVAHLVRGKKVTDALDILKFTPKRTSPILYKLVESASANAVNNFGQDSNSLYVKEVIVTEGPTYKRSLPISRGRTHPVLKRTSHITVTVESRNETTGTKKKAAETKTK